MSNKSKTGRNDWDRNSFYIAFGISLFIPAFNLITWFLVWIIYLMIGWIGYCGLRILGNVCRYLDGREYYEGTIWSDRAVRNWFKQYRISFKNAYKAERSKNEEKEMVVVQADPSEMTALEKQWLKERQERGNS